MLDFLENLDKTNIAFLHQMRNLLSTNLNFNIAHLFYQGKSIATFGFQKVYCSVNATTGLKNIFLFSKRISKKEEAMKFLSTNSNPKNIHFVLLLARLFIGALMLVHGIPKLEKLLSGAPIQFADPIGIGVTASLILAVFAEVFCSLLIMLGLLTRFACVPLIITMLVAIFQVHFNDSFSKQELAIHYLLVYFILFIAGSGKYSLDNMLGKLK